MKASSLVLTPSLVLKLPHIVVLAAMVETFSITVFFLGEIDPGRHDSSMFNLIFRKHLLFDL